MDNYEEKYKAALGWMQSLYGGLHGATKVDAEHYFPELKEDNNDEKIRKALIEMIHDTTGDECEDCYHVSKESVLAWLEKQCEQKPNPYSGTSFEYNGHIWGMCARDNGVDILLDKQLFKHLEKQDEQTTGKVEPKFKVGDWLQYRYAEPFLVEEITEQGYCNGDSCLSFEWEDEIHLWTIDDAKDGDVLVTTSIRNCPFIYRKTDNNNNLAYFYAGIDGNGNFCEGCIKRTLYHFGSASNVAPATKEQRDLLFEKMKEAGYEWDSEKKELKKIEHKMLDDDKVIAWLKTKVYDDSAYGMAMIEQLKQDSGL